MKANISYCGVPMVCEFSHYREHAQTREEPGQPEHVSVDSCLVGGVEIGEMLTHAQWDSIEELVLTWYTEEQEFQACEYADMKRKERA
jgi:hypothetical protein